MEGNVCITEPYVGDRQNFTSIGAFLGGNRIGNQINTTCEELFGNSNSRSREEGVRRRKEKKGVRGWRDNRTHNRTSYKDNQKWKGEKQRERERKMRNLKERDGKGIPKEWWGGQKSRKEK